MKTLTKLLSIIFIIMLTQSCSKDTSCGNTNDIVNNYNISADDKSKIPFKGNDTLVYISNAGDTAVLIGTGKRTFIDQVRKNNNNVDCPKYTVDNNEIISIQYSGINNAELFNIKHLVSNYSNNTGITFNVNTLSFGNPIRFFNNTFYYNDSVLINSNYIKVNLFYFDDESFVAYNYNYGFLKIQLNGGKIWLLKI